MASERAKDIIMHKTDLKCFHQYSAKSTAVAAAAAPRQRSGGDTAALVLKVLPLSAVGKLSRSSLFDVQEDEDAAEASGSRSAMGGCRDCGEWDDDKVNPSSSQLPTSGGDSEQTGATQRTSDEVSDDHSEACSHTRSSENGDNANGQQKQRKNKAMPSLVLVEVASLPPKLAAQVPHGAAIIALPRHTLKALNIKVAPASVASSIDPASYCLSEAQAALPASGGAPAPDSEVRMDLQALTGAAGDWPTRPSASTARETGGDLPAQGHADNPDS
ncbi:hypothetical protein LSCM1_01434 [Leishmania martiniquensis]|uniref:Uncharacterized protein n=1 Tax=Leishmania martiniquensis TaxID=1580590 RepID=A0A836KHX3_9TRYP|nr:hypothetical protein LSCM1_01434 [Leishmania martiniquensis]